jgi:3-hydroxyisobutyrate dehydrogenase-like beta-hydroxyacid dehydrogenase
LASIVSSHLTELVAALITFESTGKATSVKMARQLVLALLCAAVAVAAARELNQAKITVSDLPKQLQELNTRCVPAL